jgi:twitching motility protein PilT
VREYILDPERIPFLHTLIGEGVTQYGMQTFDQSVLSLLREGLITEEDALKNCNNPNELSLKLKGIAGTSDRTWQPIEAADNDPENGAPAAGSSPSPGGSSSGPSRPDWMSRE